MKLLRRPIGASDWNPDRFCVISMEFLSLSRRCSSSRNIPQRWWTRRNVCRSQATLTIDIIDKNWSTRWKSILTTLLIFDSHRLPILTYLIPSTKINLPSILSIIEFHRLGPRPGRKPYGYPIGIISVFRPKRRKNPTLTYWAHTRESPGILSIWFS